ncbi:UDP-forming cellulose synthase catalytic subunit [uncultured Oceanisphaera sp.]|uniref:UDP-forming cellulose synthase catalytic subunit n=1 Tax=uncultured Oceanisphaera sp. TaxID=353858 RepID=UPI002609C74B|nr:UDP-forming cellulose synthase catalytic subunit [uncultured Oceanisphaera sp.]
MLSPAFAYAALRRRGAGRVTALWLTGWQLMAWLILPLEQANWHRLLKARGVSHLECQPPRPGDPLRYLIQGCWLLLFRPRPERRTGVKAWLLESLAWLRLQQEQLQSWLHRRLFRPLVDRVTVPRAVRGRTWWRQRGRSKRRLTIWLILVLALLLALLGVTQPFDYTAQLFFVLLLWSLAMVVRRLSGRFPILLMIALSVLISCRYLWWRYSSTLNWNDSLDLTLGLILLAAETYSWLILLLGYVQTCWPLKRQPVPLPQDTRLWPSVDLMIPTYDEPLSVVRTTVYAALGIDWPADKLNIYILDDGGRMEFRRFADEAGVGYIARIEHHHAKAGNLNHALKQTSGELVAIFDCDHVPVRSFLQLTAGGFLQDPRLALVQTPHHFFSPDPVERNLGLFRRTPNEGELFYGLVQDGNDMWNATFFCGSCALLRRSALEEVGGIAVDTVTEDAHTALRLHRRGWNSAYMRIPQAAGLATESLSAHVGQRIRWARGMAQIFRIDNPLLGKGLTLFQRLCYANAMLHFLAGVPRLVFLLAPLAFLLLHAYIIYAPATLLLLYVLPHMMHSSLTAARMQGRYRKTFWGEVYETVLAWYIARPTMVALLAPSRGKFNVTAKGGLVEQTQFDWRIARPYLVLALLNLAGLGVGVWRFIHGPAAEQGTVVVTSLWVLYNLLIIGAAVAIAAEARQVRHSPRVSTRLPATLRLPGGHLYSGVLLDYSDDGVAIRVPGVASLAMGCEVSLLLRRGEREHVFPGVVCRSHDNVLVIHLARLSREQRIDFVQCTFARADAWMNWLEPRGRERPLQSLLEVFAIGIRGYVRLWQFMPRWLRLLCEPLQALLHWLGTFLPRWPQASVDSEKREWTT